MGSYRKKDLLAVPAAPQLGLADQLTDLLIDITACTNGKGISSSQQRSLDFFAATLHQRAASGQATVQRRASRIWDAPDPAPKITWYERDQSHFPLPEFAPRAYRVNGCRVT